MMGRFICIFIWAIRMTSCFIHRDEANDGLINSGRLPFAVDSVKVNCDGTKASLLFATVGHTAVRSTLAVYDLDTDGYRTFDFKVTGRAPETHAWVRLFLYHRMGN